MTTFLNRRIQQAPWRTRRQTVGAVLVIIISVSMIAALYLNVTTRTTLVGREIQNLEWAIGNAKEKNANLKTALAELLSYQETKTRFGALGFRPATTEEIHYLSVPGYEGKTPVNLANSSLDKTGNPLLSEAYTQSLFDWIGQQLQGDFLP